MQITNLLDHPIQCRTTSAAVANDFSATCAAPSTQQHHAMLTFRLSVLFAVDKEISMVLLV